MNQEIRETLVRLGMFEKIGVVNIVDNINDAIKLAFDKYIDAKKCTKKYLQNVLINNRQINLRIFVKIVCI